MAVDDLISTEDCEGNMCGIAGFVSKADVTGMSSLDAIKRMTHRMKQRGPDAEGVWTGNGVALGHRRLAILDLDPRSNQPMASSDGNYSIVFNGEIYNFLELRRDLEAKGVVFRTTSDTEVLLELFALEGERMLPKLRGMFALAIWNTRSRQLFLARDPYGIKPLYYSATHAGVVFASQVKALLASGMVSTELEPAGMTGFYLWGSVPEPWTLYRGVLSLPAGNWMRVRNGLAETPVCWNDIGDNWRAKGETRTAQELQDSVREAMTDSVRAHLVADVPVSVFLSAGIDSGTIAGLAFELGARLEGITVAFDEFSSLHEDEVPGAAAIAAHYGLPHYVRRISRAEFEADTPRILDAMDQPSIDGVNTWFASKAAAERGYKVVLSGVGGDELFCGYPHMRQLPRHLKWTKPLATVPAARAFLKVPCGYLARSGANPKLKGIPEFMGSLEGIYFLKRCLFLPEELPALIGVEVATEGLKRLGGSPPGLTKSNAVNGVMAVCLLESSHYLRNQLLRDSDWASMDHSLELRTPLVDARLLKTLSPLLTSFDHGAGKQLLASSPTNPLPQTIAKRQKTGFSLPMSKWLLAATDLGAWAGTPMLEPSRTPWARRWAKLVLDATMAAG